MYRKFVLGIAVGLVLGAGLTRACADDSVLDQLYGNGVHAYFGGDYSKAYDSLSAAINGGSRDPRAYYFRAFAESRLGREQDAATDFQTGATFEATGGGQSGVSQALERIQGPTRQTLEQYRANARAVALQTAPTQPSGARFIPRREAVEPTPIPPADQVRPLPPVEQRAPTAGPPGKAPIPPQNTPAEKAAEPADPFSSEPAKPAEAPAAKPAAPAAEKPAGTPDASDPFNSDTKPATPPAAKPAEKPADADPFGSDAKPAAPAEKAATPPADAKAPAGKDATADVKPQPAAARGVLKALNFGDVFSNTASNLQKAASGALQGPAGSGPAQSGIGGAQAMPAPSAAPRPTPGTTAAAPADPFSAPPAAAASNGSPPAAASPAPAGKAADPFTDEPAAKGAADAKTADKASPDMKKDQDPFKN